MIEITTTRSSMLKAIAYDEQSKVLTITFNNGGSYEYYDVPKKVFDELISAESEGKYFLANVKNKFKFEKI